MRRSARASIAGIVPLLLLAAALAAQEERRGGPAAFEQTRAEVMTIFGIVATSQTLASQAGTWALQQGGNAVDAAIAANATLGVVQPMSNGIGGDLFAIVFDARTGKLHGLNASGGAPARLTLDLARAKGAKQLTGIHAITVPGAVAGWHEMHRRFGRLSLARVLAPAIYYAENGFPVTDRIAAQWAAVGRTKARAPNFAATWLIGGRAPRAGEVFRNPDLARSLRRIAEHGRDGFYRGPAADAILQLMREQGGVMSREDLDDFRPEWIDPISTTYRGWTVWELPPNGYGVAALSMLNIMERFPLAEYGHNSARALHVAIEAKKLAYADMLRHLGDPRFARMPVMALVSKELAAERARLIDPERANCAVEPADLGRFTAAAWPDTIYMSALDRDGNIVSLIQSLFAPFGSGFVPPGTGFALHNRGSGFSLEPGGPNTLAPRKRPLHTIIPGFMDKDGVRIGFGVMGGWNQAQAHAQFVSNVVDFGMNVQAAIDAARFTKQSFAGCDITVESRVPAAVVRELERMGHEPQIVEAFSAVMGRAQAVMRDASGVNRAGSDPRGDGAAVPQGPF